MTRPLLLPLVPFYLLLQRLHSALIRPKSLPAPVISVGSLSAGGAGKTPVVLLLARLLADRGFAVRILSRGYGRHGSGIAHVDPAGPASRFGDEPVLIAQRGFDVWVGPDRYRTGLATLGGEMGLEPARTPPLFLLDDGFQHRRVARTLDLVLVTAQDFDDHLLPAGDLREPLTALARADIVLLREDEEAQLRPLIAGLHKEIWVLRRTLSLPHDAATSNRPLAFCAIARPAGFTRMLAAIGCNFAGFVSFPDHHRYGAREIARLIARARLAAADGFLTTEKDAVKLTPGMLRALAAVGPVVVAHLEVDFVSQEREQAALALLLQRIAARP